MISWYKVEDASGPYVCNKEDSCSSLQDQALLALSALASQEGGTGGRFEDFTDALVCLGRAFKVFVGTNLLADFLTL